VQFIHGDRELDNVPDLPLGLYFAPVRAARRSPDGSSVLVHDSGHPQPFSTHSEANSFAGNRAARSVTAGTGEWGNALQIAADTAPDGSDRPSVEPRSIHAEGRAR
jgi:hypothetical protein